MLDIERNWPLRHASSLIQALLVATVAAAPLNHFAVIAASDTALAPPQRCGPLGLLPSQSGTCDQGLPPKWAQGLYLDSAASPGLPPKWAQGLYLDSAASRGASAPPEAAASFVQLAAAAAWKRSLVAQAVAVNTSSRDEKTNSTVDKNTSKALTVPPIVELEQKNEPKPKGRLRVDKAALEWNLEQEPWRRVGRGNKSGFVVKPVNSTELGWLTDALQNATRRTRPFNKLVKEGAAKEVHTLAKSAVLPSVAIIMLSMLVSSYLSSFPYAVTKFIPECLITVMVAGLLGFFIRHMIKWGLFSTDAFELVDASILNLVLLPVIIFNGGWSINLPHFSSQFIYCLIFAVAGTVVTMMFVGQSFWFVANQLGWTCMSSLRATMAFAALISATDPVATLATYAELDIARRQPLLNTLVLGESLINDAVAIALFDGLNTLHKTTWHGIHVGLLTRMLILLAGSMIFGILTASALIFIMRLARLPGQTTMEILYIFMAPFLIFSLADTVELSGIIAVLFAGIMMKTYGTQHLTHKGRHLADEFLEVAAKLADTGVFVLCGTSTALVDTLDGAKFGALAVLLCLLGRAVATVFCTVTCNAVKRVTEEFPSYINFKHAFMIWLGGLRGGIALVLALELDESWCSARTKEMIINTTFIVICAHLLLCGGTTELFLVTLGMVPPPKTGRRRMSGLDWSSANLCAEDSSEEEEISEEHHSLVISDLNMPTGIGDWLHSWFEYVLVGESVEFQRQISNDAFG